jgi:conjugal transfer pilus assembly protein TraV
MPTQLPAPPASSRAAPPQILTLVGALTLALAGCADLSGLGASSKFNCKAPEGIPCMSVSGIDANERAGTLPLLRTADKVVSAAPGTASDAVRAADGGPSLQAAPRRLLPSGAIRSDPTVARIWIAPWEDTDGDLHDEHYVYMQLDSGRWLIEHNRQRIQRAFAPGTARGSSVADAAPASAAGAPPSPAPSPAPQSVQATPSPGVPAAGRVPALNRDMQQRAGQSVGPGTGQGAPR